MDLTATTMRRAIASYDYTTCNDIVNTLMNKLEALPLTFPDPGRDLDELSNCQLIFKNEMSL